MVKIETDFHSDKEAKYDLFFEGTYTAISDGYLPKEFAIRGGILCLLIGVIFLYLFTSQHIPHLIGSFISYTLLVISALLFYIHFYSMFQAKKAKDDSKDKDIVIISDRGVWNDYDDHGVVIFNRWDNIYKVFISKNMYVFRSMTGFLFLSKDDEQAEAIETYLKKHLDEKKIVRGKF